jgi:threonine synthase
VTPFHYRCSLCGTTYARDDVRYLCPSCGREYRPGVPLPGVLEVEFDADRLCGGVNEGLSDDEIFLPIERGYVPPLAVGNTPFMSVPRLAQALGCSHLHIKNDGANPSGSLKDRASMLVVAEARRLNEKTIVTASTGNAASALAALCASAGCNAVIFVPATAPRAKLAQMILYGATVVPVDGTYDDAFALSLQYTAVEGGLNRNTAYHPLTIEGKKTAGIEIFRQNWSIVPDLIVIPVGDGVILSGIHKAFLDLRTAGVTEHLPRLLGVQADSSDAIHRFVQSGNYSDAASPVTVADSISVRTPSNAYLARKAILESGGATITVTDAEILSAQRLLAATSGVFAEPAASAAVAGLQKALAAGIADADSGIVLLITGHGLKDIDAALHGVTMPRPVAPDLESVRAFLKDTAV